MPGFVSTKLSTQGAADATEGLGRGTPAEGAQGPRGRKLTAGAQPVGVCVDLGDLWSQISMAWPGFGTFSYYLLVWGCRGQFEFLKLSNGWLGSGGTVPVMPANTGVGIGESAYLPEPPKSGSNWWWEEASPAPKT